MEELLTYCVAQVAGAIAAALVLFMILSGKASGWNGALGQTTWSEYNTLSAFIFETVGTFLFLVCILGVTRRGAPGARRNRHRTDTCCHTPRWDQYLWIIGKSGAIARPAMVGYAHNPEALKQIWLYILAPLIGAGVAGYLFRSGLLAAETVIPMRAKASRRCHPRRRHRVILGAGDARSSPQAVRAKNGSEPIWRLPHSRKSPLWVKSGHQSGDGVGLLCAISRNREGCRAFIKNDPNGCSVMPRQ